LDQLTPHQGATQDELSCGLKEGAAGAIGEQQLQEFRNSRASAGYIGKEGMVIPVRLFRMNSLKEEEM
jgi:hypothetical protein